MAHTEEVGTGRAGLPPNGREVFPINVGVFNEFFTAAKGLNPRLTRVTRSPKSWQQMRGAEPCPAIPVGKLWQQSTSESWRSRRLGGEFITSQQLWLRGFLGNLTSFPSVLTQVCVGITCLLCTQSDRRPGDHCWLRAARESRSSAGRPGVVSFRKAANSCFSIRVSQYGTGK